MYKKPKQSRRQIFQYQTKDIAEMQENIKRHQEYAKNEAIKKASNEYKRGVKRNNFLQQLDKRNKNANLE